jgi:hypothetical protein
METLNFWHFIIAYAGLLMHLMIKLMESPVPIREYWNKQTILSLALSVVGIPVLLIVLSEPVMKEILPLTYATALLAGHQTQSFLRSFVMIASRKYTPEDIARVIIIVLLAGALTGCAVTKKQRDRVCAGCPVKIERHDSISYIHDTAYFPIPAKAGPPIYLENPCAHLCDSLGNLKSFSITEKKNGITTNVKSVGNSIAINSETDPDTAAVPFMHKNTYHSEEREVPVCDKEHRTWVDYACRWFTYLVGGYLVLRFLFRKYWSVIVGRFKKPKS